MIPERMQQRGRYRNFSRKAERCAAGTFSQAN